MAHATVQNQRSTYVRLVGLSGILFSWINVFHTANTVDASCVPQERVVASMSINIWAAWEYIMQNWLAQLLYFEAKSCGTQLRIMTLGAHGPRMGPRMGSSYACMLTSGPQRSQLRSACWFVLNFQFTGIRTVFTFKPMVLTSRQIVFQTDSSGIQRWWMGYWFNPISINNCDTTYRVFIWDRRGFCWRWQALLRHLWWSKHPKQMSEAMSGDNGRSREKTENYDFPDQRILKFETACLGIVVLWPCYIKTL